MIHLLETSQIIHASIERALDFFSDPRKLAKITRSELDFTIPTALPERNLSGHDDRMLRAPVITSSDWIASESK
jgi:hypothetical protein